MSDVETMTHPNAKKKVIPVCGEDYCEACGDCLACYGEDRCYGTEDGKHVFIPKEETNETNQEG